VDRDGPSLAARGDAGVTLVDLERDVGLFVLVSARLMDSEEGMLLPTRFRPCARVRPTTPAPMIMTGFSMAIVAQSSRCCCGED
jgi:hypothetical protein